LRDANYAFFSAQTADAEFSKPGTPVKMLKIHPKYLKLHKNAENAQKCSYSPKFD
jgi:hypothetical protein